MEFRKFHVAVGTQQFEAGEVYVQLSLDAAVPLDVFALTPERAREIARRLYWAARMVDRLNEERLTIFAEEK